MEKDAGAISTFLENAVRFARGGRKVEQAAQAVTRTSEAVAEANKFMEAAMRLRHGEINAAQFQKITGAKAGTAEAVENIARTMPSNATDAEYADKLLSNVSKDVKSVIREGTLFDSAGRYMNRASEAAKAVNPADLELIKGDYPIYRDPEGYYYISHASLRRLPDDGYAYMNEIAPTVDANGTFYLPLKHDPELKKAIEASGKVRRVDAEFRPLDGKPLPFYPPKDILLGSKQLERVRADPDFSAGIVIDEYGNIKVKYEKLPPEGQRRWDTLRGALEGDYVIRDEHLDTLLNASATAAVERPGTPPIYRGGTPPTNPMSPKDDIYTMGQDVVARLSRDPSFSPGLEMDSNGGHYLDATKLSPKARSAWESMVKEVDLHSGSNVVDIRDLKSLQKVRALPGVTVGEDLKPAANLSEDLFKATTPSLPPPASGINAVRGTVPTTGKGLGNFK